MLHIIFLFFFLLFNQISQSQWCVGNNVNWYYGFWRPFMSGCVGRNSDREAISFYQNSAEIDIAELTPGMNVSNIHMFNWVVEKRNLVIL